MADRPTEAPASSDTTGQAAGDTGVFHIPLSSAGSAQVYPSAWNGPRSDTAFTARFEDGAWVLAVRIEAETPVVLSNPSKDRAHLELQAELIDLALAVAKNADAFDDDEIAENAIGLAFFRDYYRMNGEMIHDRIEETRHAMEVSAENARRMESNRRSAEAMCRISDRIDAALLRALPAKIYTRLGPIEDASFH